jgi:aerobic-type carbon monoxide dehydrogenase small subunit (CoxS/CutS family)
MIPSRMDAKITFTVNRQQRTVTTDPRRPLLDVLREDLQLTGTRFGCGQGDCGACSVIVDGKRAFSCSTAIGDLEGKSVQTIEGLANGSALHPIQQAFLNENAFQCAYCTSGMIMAAVALLEEKPAATDAEIREGMNGNLCRCCAQPRILNAVRSCSKAGK